MVSIKKLEKLIKPYEKEGEWGVSDGFGHTYQGYRNGPKKSRLDSAVWGLVENPRETYKNELVRVATELGLTF